MRICRGFSVLRKGLSQAVIMEPMKAGPAAKISL